MFWVHFNDGSLEYIPGVSFEQEEDSKGNITIKTFDKKGALVHNEQYKKGEFSFLELDGRPAKNPFK